MLLGILVCRNCPTSLGESNVSGSGMVDGAVDISIGDVDASWLALGDG